MIRGIKVGLVNKENEYKSEGCSPHQETGVIALALKESGSSKELVVNFMLGISARETLVRLNR